MNVFKNKLFIVLVFIIFAILIMINLSSSPLKNKKSLSDTSDREFVSIMIGDETKLDVEIVNSAASTSQGLSGRDDIGSDGMLFIFPERSKRVFWMLDMKFDLDLVWISDDRVVGMTKNAKKPERDVKNQDIERVSVNEYSNKVLELYAGDIDKYKIEVGDVVILK